MFDNNDYNSSDGMLTYVWGPSLWHFLHTMSFNYPVNPTEQQKNHYNKFIISIKEILPCKYCRENFRNNLKTSNFNKNVFDNRHTFSKWMYDLHNCVNVMLGKSISLSYKEVRNRYENFRARCLENPLKQSTSKKRSIRKSIRKKSKKKKTKKRKSKKIIKEKGCTEPFYGKKSRCIIRIIPKDRNEETLTVDKECVLKK